MDVSALVAELRRHGPALVAGARAAGLGAAVPTCPEWTVRDLLEHTGMVHRWAAAHVSGRRTEPLDDAATAAIVGPVPSGEELLDWYAAGHAALVEALEAAPADVECWSFLPAPSPLAFWARRQAHECAIHRADADRAAGREPSYDAGFAADGIDELLAGFLARRRGGLVSDPPRRLDVVLSDRPECWTMLIGPDSRQVARTAGATGEPADCTVRGPASAVYQLLWNRRGREGIDVAGDPAVLDLFAAKAHIRWS